MPVSWTLEYGATTQSFAAWGISAPRREVSDDGNDLFGFDIPGAMDAAAVFPDGAQIIVYRDGVKWWQGQRIRNLREGSPEMERLSYQFAGPWVYLNWIVFQQITKSYNNSTHVLDDIYQSRLWLCQAIDGTKLTTAQQIADILEYANDLIVEQTGGAKFQLGGGYPSVNAPIDEVQDITCAEAIRKMLRWSPDAVVWFDHSTTPPTLYIKSRAALAAATVALFAGGQDNALTINRRDDILVPSVHFKYRVTAQIDGNSYITTVDDIAPGGATGREINAVVATFDFDGGSITRQFTTLECDLINPGSLAWWKARVPELNDPRYITTGALTMAVVGGTEGITPSAADGNINEFKGQIPDWMNVSTAHKVITAQILCALKDAGGDSDTDNDKRNSVGIKNVSHRCNATEAESGTYSAVVAFSVGEVVPTGLAAQFYDMLSAVHYEGQMTIEAEDVGGAGDPALGNKLNLTGGMLEWETMNALIRGVTYDLFSGKTSISFGPAPFLGAGDLVELLRVNRFRHVWSYTARTQGVNRDSDVELPTNISKENSGGFEGTETLKKYQSGTVAITHDAPNSTVKIVDSSGTGKSVTINLSALPDGVELELREYPICIDHVAKTFWAIGSEPA